MTNSLHVINPYRDAGSWVFDDESVGLRREPFVSGIPLMIEKLLESAGVSDPANLKSFRLIFSGNPFPNPHARIDLLYAENGGNWYRWDEHELEGWLCPALFKYFESAPAEIYVRAETPD